jgi:2-dehydro-3-deoxygalactonokinase
VLAVTGIAPRPDWIAVDWGTSNLRAWAMGPTGSFAETTSDEGMGRLTPDAFEPALIRLIEPWIDTTRITQVLACGMVGARQGWTEAAYRAVPCTPLDAGQMTRVRTTDQRIAVSIAPGLKQLLPPDVMRGEETQIAGALALSPGFDGVICLPGTHTKWARVSAGEIVSFQTFMTGEMFALLSQQSVLRHGMAGDGWDDAAFDQSIADGLARPERIAARLFSLRAEGLIAGLGADAARARLSGLLIGTELAGSRAYWLGQNVTLVGSPRLSAAYARALCAQGIDALSLPADDCTLAGLSTLARQIKVLA